MGRETFLVRIVACIIEILENCYLLPFAARIIATTIAKDHNLVTDVVNTVIAGRRVIITVRVIRPASEQVLRSEFPRALYRNGKRDMVLPSPQAMEKMLVVKSHAAMALVRNWTVVRGNTKFLPLTRLDHFVLSCIACSSPRSLQRSSKTANRRLSAVGSRSRP